MSYHRTNSPISININMVTNGGSPVNGLGIADVLLTLLREGITQNIVGKYTFAPQQRGIYRITFEASLMSIADVDYLLIAQDITNHAMDDKIEFTLYNESLDTVKSSLLTDISNIPTTPLLTSDSRLNFLTRLDTTVSSLPLLGAQASWSYSSRSLTGTSGINQIDINGLSSNYLVGQSVYLNLPLQDTSGNFITGRIYPVDLHVDIWKGGVHQNNSSHVTVSEPTTGVYRVSIDGTMIDTPAVDYLVVLSDTSNVGRNQIREFTAFQVSQVLGPRIVTIQIIDSFTLLPIPDVQVYVKDSSNVITINKGITGVDGKYITGLSNGIYHVFLRKSFVDFTVPEILIVDSDVSNVYTGISFIPALPTTPATCIVYGFNIGMDGKPIKNIKVVATDPLNSRYSGTIKIGKLVKTTFTDINGYWALEMIRSSLITPKGVKYNITQSAPGYLFTKSILVPDTSSVEFSTL